MKKKRPLKALWPPGVRFKTVVAVLLLLGSVHSVLAESYLQSRRMSLNLENVSLSELIDAISEKSDYSFYFNEENIAPLQDVTVNKSDATVEEILNEVLNNTGLTFSMIDGVIVIKALEENVSELQQPYQETIRGTVADRKTGELLPGVNVVVKNSRLGTITDVNGEFEISMPSGKKALIFSFIGYQMKEVPLDGKHILNVQLDEEIHKLGDVVVTGYQTIDRRASTSSIEVIKADDLDKIGSLTVDQMLEGKATGLMATQLSSTPGAASKVRIRSGGTFTGSRAPLWVVDDIIYDDPVPLTADDINSFDRVNLIGNALTGLNPQDIESINILKDAAATAIWGTRAANGVIVITTKRGKVGKANFTYSGNTSVQIAPSYSDFDLMNSKERIDVSREMHQRLIGYNEELIHYTGYEKALYDFRSGTIDYNGFKNEVARYETMNTDWFGELYR
ncbi:MAG: carboxypeptidase-like regulatory domain-containing protein, partial [Bacteroidales bacterium]|nr:carboxypeptidase-like regulatory domain-containing protein [Bacteroidales bacterium]